MDRPPIPGGVRAALADLFSNEYTHTKINQMFMLAGAPGEPPEGSKSVKVDAWLHRLNVDMPHQAYSVLGRLLEEFMDRVLVPSNPWTVSYYGQPSPEQREAAYVTQRAFVVRVLQAGQLEYLPGGRVLRLGHSQVARQLGDLIRDRDMPSLAAEFERATKDADMHPREALSAAANILEALLGEMIHLWGLVPPNDRTLRNLWKTVKDALKLDPKAMPDPDLTMVVGAMGATVEGLSGLRNDKSTAHAMKPELARNYKLQPRHARLAINAAYGLTAFLIETMDHRGTPGSSKRP